MFDSITLVVSVCSIVILWSSPLIRICFPNIPDPQEIYVELYGLVTFLPSVLGHIIGFILGLIRIRSAYGKLSLGLIVVSLVIVFNNLKGDDPGR